MVDAGGQRFGDPSILRGARSAARRGVAACRLEALLEEHDIVPGVAIEGLAQASLVKTVTDKTDADVEGGVM